MLLIALTKYRKNDKIENGYYFSIEMRVIMRPSDYKTKQKEKILNFLKENSNRHVTASDIISYLSNGEDSVGSATVYRYLEKLVSSDVVRKFYLDEKTGACYQFIENGEECHEHFHLKCIGCGKLYHIDCEYMQSLCGHVFEHHGFKVDNSKTVLYGKCDKCEKEI